MKFDDLKIKEIHNVVRYTPDKFRFSSKNKSEHIVGIQISGKALHCFADKQLIFKESCVYFLNQAEDYDVKVIEKGLAFSVHFTTYEPILTESFCLHAQNPQKIINILETAEREYFKKNTLALFELFYRLCARIHEIYTQKFSLKDKRITTAEKYMKEHFQEDTCLKNAIATSRLSARRFNDLFKECFYETPNRYLSALKISYAKTLMHNEQIGITQISALCGFNDSSYFSKTFKQITGASPADYRKSLSKSN